MYRKKCPKCSKKNWCGIEYTCDCPEYYDGVSEWQCMECKTRWGRWSGKELKDGECEPKFGGTSKRIKDDFGDVLEQLSTE
jgi:hypothetical protein